MKQRVNDKRQCIPFGDASSGLRGTFHIAGNHDINRYPLKATCYECCLAPSQLGERRMPMLVGSLLIAFCRSMPDEIHCFHISSHVRARIVKIFELAFLWAV